MGPARDAAALDAADALASWRDEFVIAGDVLYLDGNSLGRLPKRAAAAIGRAVAEEWGVGLVTTWRTDWLALPGRVGDLLATLVGAAPGEVLISDQTSVNLYKLASAALDHTGRPDVVSDGSNFPSDLYVLEGIAAARGGRLRVVGEPDAGPPDARSITEALDDRVGLVAMSHIDYRTSRTADMNAITTAAHSAGALALWDLSHSVGVYPVDLDSAAADLAVGCTYKYLNGGPGAPGFLFVRRDLQADLSQPIHGWFGHADQFSFSRRYSAAPGIDRFAVGTPPILSLRGAQAGVELAAEAGIDAIRAKSVSLTGFLLDLCEQQLASLGFDTVTPRNPDRRGGHVGISHPAAWQITQALLDAGVVPDFRAPDVIRLAPSPLYTRFVDVFDAVGVIRDVVESRAYLGYPDEHTTVT